ncbi:mechanosensitive ion channel domain-containing protein [Halorhabdus sp. BNX81]|uniref:mechanosensitive ion channel family protein n=1 Tax=Halorhabdus sp. BNX81 TaxID=2980181 RepID=UPI0023DD066A|nr:mechanosensitive ion channel domain-containing protein [Halorhabdus sp. BNX81]WEL21763.1 Small-conductance mechanosensitive channel [Halorhabdus sp. BNX81]
MTRRLPYALVFLAVASASSALAVGRIGVPWFDPAGEALFVEALTIVTILSAAFGGYWLVLAYLSGHAVDKRRRHDARNVLRLTFGIVATVATLGALTDQWVGMLVSLGVVGFAVTFALQQPLFSLIGWFYILVNRPYQVGDRIAIEDTRGDVVSIGFFVTEVWEIDGDLVSTNQPSGRIITVPNSVVLSSHVVNFYGEGVPYVWNELSIQVAYETDLDYATEVMIAVADEHLGEEMANEITNYRDRLAETPVELDVTEEPTVNVRQAESWVELRLRYLVHPRRGTRARNAMYETILERFNDNPDRVAFPVSRSR